MKIKYDPDIHMTVPCYEGERVPVIENEEGEIVCGYVKDGGDLCLSTIGVSTKKGGLCSHHQKSDKQRSVEKNRSKLGRLRPSDLPTLDCHEHAEIWLDRIGRAVATGDLAAQRAQAALRAVSEFNKTRAEKISSEEMEDLEQQIEAIKKDMTSKDNFGY